MPRKARIGAPGALRHILVKGIERERIFCDDSDCDNFVTQLTLILPERLEPCFAWALIPNYLHFLFLTGTVPISIFMRRLLIGHVLAFNRRYRFEFEFTQWMSLR